MKKMLKSFLMDPLKVFISLVGTGGILMASDVAVHNGGK